MFVTCNKEQRFVKFNTHSMKARKTAYDLIDEFE